MGLNVAGLAAGYQGYALAQRQAAEDDRLAKSAARADADAAFQDELRTRQRTEWKEDDRKKADDKADVLAANEKFDAPASATGTGVSEKATQAAIAQALEVPKDLLSGATAAPAAPATPASVVAAGAADPAWAAPAAKQGKPALDLASAPVALGPVKAAGIPPAHNFNNTLAKAAFRLQRKSDRNDISAEDYAKGVAFLDQVKKQGITDALELMAQGRYDEALDKYNSSGSMNGARIISGAEGTTKINGQDTPTHFVTIANADGTRTTMDVARARYQLLDINSQLNHQGQARQLDMQGSQHAESIKLQREHMTQQAKDAEAGRALQKKSLQIQLDQFNASTPLGQITALGQALGKKLTAEQIENRLGVSKIPRAVELQVQSLIRESDVEAAAMAKAITSPEGINPNAATTFQKNSAIRNVRLNQLLAPYSGAAGAQPAADPLNLNDKPGGARVPNPIEQSPPVGPAPAPVVRHAAGVAAAQAAAAQPRTTPMPKGAIDVRDDPVIASLRRATDGMDMQNPKNTQSIMALGKARSERLAQLQQNYGPHAILFAD